MKDQVVHAEVIRSLIAVFGPVVEPESTAGLETVTGVQPASALPPGLAELHRSLTLRITQLASQDPEQLFRLLYRIDVDERVARSSLAAGDPGALAGAVILRVMEKAASRRDIHFDDDPEPGEGGAM